ncbi:MAG: hypothetical protein N3A01_02100 [Bacteroidales bacterium]|nr:hypothetical protein [Bacteroidales bacterium]
MYSNKALTHVCVLKYRHIGDTDALVNLQTGLLATINIPDL